MENYAIKKFAIAVGCADVYCLKSAADDGLFKIFIRHKTIVDIIINNKNVNKSNKPSGCLIGSMKKGQQTRVLRCLFVSFRFIFRLFYDFVDEFQFFLSHCRRSVTTCSCRLTIADPAGSEYIG